MEFLIALHALAGCNHKTGFYEVGKKAIVVCSRKTTRSSQPPEEL